MATHPGIPNHICMLDGPDYPNPARRSEHNDLLKENERLKALLLKNGISWVPEKPKELVKLHKMKTRKSSASEYHLPHLPMEIQLRILGFAMRSSLPIIDPFCKPRIEHLSKDERTKRKELPVRILETCKAYHEEGYKLFFDNSFVFTQVAALENFAKISPDFRSTINYVTLRVVGRYYDDHSSKRNLLGDQYHPAIPEFKIPVSQRPKGAEMDRGIHAYCWQQFADFMMSLQIPSSSRRLTKLFPALSRMRVDLVNFSDHLHYPGPNFATVLRWHAGPFLDEIVVTGIPEDDPEEGPEHMFSRLVKDEGVFASGPPIFASLAKSVKTLPPLGLAVRVVRADEESKAIRQIQNRDRKIKRHRASGVDPHGGTPPKSYYPPGRTIWKFTQDSLTNQERKWIEFDRESGWPADDIDMWSDMGDSVMYDSEGNFLDSAGNPLNSDDDMDDDEDDDDNMPNFLEA